MYAGDGQPRSWGCTLSPAWPQGRCLQAGQRGRHRPPTQSPEGPNPRAAWSLTPVLRGETVNSCGVGLRSQRPQHTRSWRHRGARLSRTRRKEVGSRSAPPGTEPLCSLCPEKHGGRPRRQPRAARHLALTSTFRTPARRRAPLEPQGPDTERAPPAACEPGGTLQETQCGPRGWRPVRTGSAAPGQRPGRCTLPGAPPPPAGRGRRPPGVGWVRVPAPAAGLRGFRAPTSDCGRGLARPASSAGFRQGPGAAAAPERPGLELSPSVRLGVGSDLARAGVGAWGRPPPAPAREPPHPRRPEAQAAPSRTTSIPWPRRPPTPALTLPRRAAAERAWCWPRGPAPPPPPQRPRPLPVSALLSSAHGFPLTRPRRAPGRVSPVRVSVLRRTGPGARDAR